MTDVAVELIDRQPSRHLDKLRSLPLTFTDTLILPPLIVINAPRGTGVGTAELEPKAME